MNLWTEIVSTALIGCESKQLSFNEATGELRVLLAQLDQNDREGSLLSAAAIVSLYKRAAALPVKDDQPLPEACEPDDRPHCGVGASNHLAMILRGEHQELLPEWLGKSADAGMRAPEELAPRLLEYGRTQKAMSKEISQALRARGHWLAAQNPAWAYVAVVDETPLEKGPHRQRKLSLAEMRKADAARGREWLAIHWWQASSGDRKGFLNALENGLSLDDEAFLEAALEDESKEIRRMAAHLLARLPESALGRWVFECVRPLITFKIDDLRRKTIEVAQKAIMSDAVAPNHYYQSLDLKGWWFERLLGLISPRVWSQ
ncbi:MAG TPA: DUF5691 domain-containing protein, partial [Blastocatellia bacterium]